ncbi:MAG: tRNA guanosine(34) transglycosylase Tgt [Candidatus Babeliales bacterium]|nr:tRNA guanosine(34) transglycosylase Tgt [Candidatus Babeliales bacterium]
MSSFFKFEILHKSKISKARVGRIHTPHGIIDTPNFVGVGTNGTLKALDNKLVDALGLQLMFCNTYHMMLQPGTQIVKQAGGLHKFIGRKNPIITDSGGFQVFSLAYGTVKDELKSKGQKRQNNSVIKISEDGVLFRSYREGNLVLLTPETSIQAQKDLGADIIIPFDELPPYHIDKKLLKQSLDRTHRWEKRSLDYHLANRNNQAMYSVIHGGLERDFRAESAKYLGALDFDGHAIGGSLGKNHEDLYELLNFVMPLLPEEKPNHLLGIGDLKSVEQVVKSGIDTMDSSHPTRCARHGLLFTSDGGRKILAGSAKFDFGAPVPGCECYTCQNYSMSYLNHLFKASELTAYTLATIHNVHYMVKLMQTYRQLILEDKI